MSNYLLGTTVMVIGGCATAVSVLLFFLSYIYSRFIFNAYLKKHYRNKWEEMVHNETYRGSNIFSFDKTYTVWKFRYESNEDFGDEKIRKLRKVSVGLLKAGMTVFLSVAFSGILAFVIAIIIK